MSAMRKAYQLALTLYTRNISMHILHTVFYTIPKVLTRRICLSIKRILSQ